MSLSLDWQSRCCNTGRVENTLGGLRMMSHSWPKWLGMSSSRCSLHDMSSTQVRQMARPDGREL